MSSLLGRELERGFNLLLTYLPTNFLTRKRAAFTKPSGGTSESERRTIISENRAFHFNCERCRLTRGAVDIKSPKAAFTLAEMMVVLLIMTIVLAAGAPMMTTRYKKDTSNPWKWLSTGSIHAYFGDKDKQVGMIGQKHDPTDDELQAKLIINSTLTDHILFKNSDNILGRLRFQNGGILLGTLADGTTLGTNALALGNSVSTGDNSNSTMIAIGNDSNVIRGIAIGNNAHAYGIAIGGNAWNSVVKNANPVAIGGNSFTSGDWAVALGTASNAHIYSVAIGANTEAGGAYKRDSSGNIVKENNLPVVTEDGAWSATAVGSGARASAKQSLALGANTRANAKNSIAIGGGLGNSIEENLGAVANGDYSIAIGQSALTKKNNSIAIGKNAETEWSETIAIGNGAKTQQGIAIGTPQTGKDYVTVSGVAVGKSVYSVYGVAVGTGAYSKSASTSVGYFSHAGDAAVAIGQYAYVGAAPNDGTAVGYKSAAGWYGVALGSKARAGYYPYADDDTNHVPKLYLNSSNLYEEGNVAIGASALAYTCGAMAIGGDANSTMYYAIALGRASRALGRSAIAIGGDDAQYTGSNFDSATAPFANAHSIAIGSVGTRASEPNAIGIGTRTKATAEKSIALGYKAEAKAENSVAIGTETIADTENTIVLGSNHDVIIPKSLTVASVAVPSDKRLKNIGKEFTSGLDKIRELKVFNFTYKDDKTKTPRVGVIAQDLQKVFPNAVRKDSKGYLSVRMEDMFYAVINAIKELDVKFNALRKENEQLKKENLELKKSNSEILKRLEALEQKIK